MRKSVVSRLAVMAVATASLGLLPSATASAATTDQCSSNYNAITTFDNPADGHDYSLGLGLGTLSAEFNNNHQTLSIAYQKTGGSQISAAFGYLYPDGSNCAAVGYEPFTETTGQTKSYAWNDDSDFSHGFVYALMYVTGQGTFAIRFTDVA